MDELREYEEAEKRRREINLNHLTRGVKFIDLNSAYIDEEVEIGKGTIIYPNVILEGRTVIGEKCIIGQSTRIQDSIVGNETEIQHSVILKSEIGNETNVGPFAYIRPDSKIGDHVKVGDFVEVKNATMANGSKASHLTYIGDSDIGENVNLGCGVIFVNYDGQSKHRSVIRKNSFIGCNTNIISPVTVEEGAYVAAGTTVTRNVPKGALCIGRTKERNIEGWVQKRGLLDKKK